VTEIEEFEYETMVTAGGYIGLSAIGMVTFADNNESPIIFVAL